jgi:hypothetical protein
MANQPSYTDSVEMIEELFNNAADIWSQSLQKFANVGTSTPMPTLDPSALIDPVFAGAQRLLSSNPLAERLLELNRGYMKDVTETVLSFQGIVRDHTTAVTEVMRDQVGAATDIAKEQAGKVKKVVEDQAAQTQRAARRTTRATAKS